MFIKRGEGKILSVIEDEADLEKQKKALKASAQPKDLATSETRKQGAN